MDAVTPTTHSRMDHLVFAVPELESGVAYIEKLLGVETSPGGRHDGVGTRNRLVGLGPGSYIEVVSVDLDQPEPRRPRWFGLDDLDAPRLATWCAKGHDLDDLVSRGRAAGIELGDPRSGGRMRPDGSRVTWTVTDPWAHRAEGVVPFFIDWGDTTHPAVGLPASCTLVGLRVEHPQVDVVEGWLRALGLDTPISRGHAPRVVATLRTPAGTVELS